MELNYGNLVKYATIEQLIEIANQHVDMLNKKLGANYSNFENKWFDESGRIISNEEIETYFRSESSTIMNTLYWINNIMRDKGAALIGIADLNPDNVDTHYDSAHKALQQPYYTSALVLKQSCCDSIECEKKIETTKENKNWATYQLENKFTKNRYVGCVKMPECVDDINEFFKKNAASESEVMKTIFDNEANAANMCVLYMDFGKTEESAKEYVTRILNNAFTYADKTDFQFYNNGYINEDENAIDLLKNSKCNRINRKRSRGRKNQLITIINLQTREEKTFESKGACKEYLGCGTQVFKRFLEGKGNLTSIWTLKSATD